MIRAIPLTAIPLIAYNLIGYGLSGADPWASRLFAITMLSGARWTPTLGDLLVLLAILVLFAGVMRAARPPGRSISTHVLSTIVATVYLVEFIAAVIAAHSVFFILTVIALFDVAAGFAIAPRVEEDVVFDDDIERA